MPAVTRKGDSCTGHGTFPPRSSSGGSSNVIVNGKAAHRQGDGWSAHRSTKKPYPVHGGALAGGSSTVFVNGKPLGRVGDGVSCGSAVAQGSSDVIAG